SSDASRATVPDSVTVAAGASSATFLITTLPASADASVNISAAYGGITKTAALSLTDNVYPAVSITSPEDGITFPIGEQLAVTVNATDSDGTISGVSLWEADPDGRNPVFFAEDTTAPYTFNVFRNEPMVRSYFAVATDNRGAAVRSSHVTVRYNDPEAAMTISGRVLHEQYGAPMSGVTMTLRQSFQPYATMQTGADGRFTFTNLSRSGSYELTPKKAGYQFYPPAVSWEGLPEDVTWDFIAAGGPAPGPAPTPTPGAPTPAWDAFYNGPQNLYDLNSKVAVDTQGNVYVTGSSYGSGSDEDIVTVKYDANGVEKWAKRFNGPGNYKDIPIDIRVDAAGNAYVVGTSYKALGDTGYDFATLKYDAAGNLAWVKYYDGARSLDDSPQSMSIDSAGSVYITGMTREGPLPEHPYGGYATVKYDTDGNEKWVRYFKGFGNGAMPVDLQVDGAGNVVVTGTVTLYNGGSSQDIYTIKYNTNGDELWTAQFDSAQNPMVDEDAAHSLALDALGNVYIAGRSWKTERPGILVLKYTSGGLLEWERNAGGDDDSAEKIIVDSSGNAYITGQKYNPGGGAGADVLTIKIDTEGVEQWWRIYDGPGGNRADAGILMVLDNAGNLYVGAQSQGFNFSTDLTAIKYLPDGTESWVYRYDNGNLESDGLTGMAIDRSNNLYLTGNSQIANHASDISTVKLLPATVETGDAPPSAAMVNPPAEAVFIPGSNITLEADAATSSGQITKVEFYAGTTLVGTDKTAPYNVTWNNVAENHYKLTARVTNSFGSMKSSTLVPITVGSPATTHSISGRVKNGTTGVGGVSISLTGAQTLTRVTDANGNYSFNNLSAGGNYTVKPTTAGYTYAPAIHTYTNLGANQTNQDFAATQRGQSVSGVVKLGAAGLSGVSMTITSASPAGFAPRTVLTSGDGAYAFTNLPSGRNYQLTAAKVNHNFTPASKSYTNLIANKVNQNFTATLRTYTLSGRVNVGTPGLSGVTMTLTSASPAGFAPRTLTTAANGGYSFTNLPAGRAYRLTPTKDGYTIKNSANATQAFRSYSNLNANQTDQNFTATPKNYTISGVVKLGAVALSGVTVTLTSPTPAGFAPRTVTTAANGAYSFTNLPAGRAYRVTPTKTGYAIKNSANAAQAFRSFTSLTANQLNQNFTATQTKAGAAAY
ncbi:MAG: carboxypeptidase regulatory-like domain-containing protein, partial [Pyrinomonadaceae bacterium]